MRKIQMLAIAVGGLCLLGLGAFGGWVAGHRDEPLSAAPAVMAGDAPVGSALGALRPVPGEPLLTPEESLARVAADRKAAQSAVAKVVSDGKQNLQAEFQGQRVNTAWARAKETELEKRVVDPQMEAISAIPTAFDVECRSSACRIVAEFPNRSAADDWLTLYLTTNGGLLPRVSFNQTPQPDGSIKLEVLGSTM